MKSRFLLRDDIPPTGLDKECTLSFNSTQPYPTSSTCALELTLPTKYGNYDNFKKHTNIAFTMNGGFGLV